MTDETFGRVAKGPTARVLEIFLIDPGQAYHAEQLATLLDWGKNGPRTVLSILNRLAGDQWLEVLPPLRRSKRGRRPRPFRLTELGLEQATLFVAEVQAREVLTAWLLQLMLDHAETAFSLQQFAQATGVEPHRIGHRVASLLEAGWIVEASSYGKFRFFYTFNPAARADIDAFIALVVARSLEP